MQSPNHTATAAATSRSCECHMRGLQYQIAEVPETVMGLRTWRIWTSLREIYILSTNGNVAKWLLQNYAFSYSLDTMFALLLLHISACFYKDVLII